MTEINIRKGDSLGTVRNGVYNYPCGIQARDMNTAVILNQSSFNGVFQSNEWKGGGRHYPAIYPSGYHLPIQTLLPIAGLKQLSLGKTPESNKWANLHGVYSTQIPVAPIFSAPLLTLTPVKQHLSRSATELNQLNDENLTSTIVPQFSTTLSQSQTKSPGLQSYHVPLTPVASHSSSSAPELIQRTTQSLTSSNVPQFSTISTQSQTPSTRGYHHQSVAENVRGNLGYTIQSLGEKQNGIINTKSPPNSAVKLTELLTHNNAHTNNSKIKTFHEKQRNVTLTRKRSSSWPSGSGLSKKKFIDGQTQDDQIIEEYKNLEMDVANILISDIPFPVISPGVSEAGKISVSRGRDMVVGSREIMEPRSNVWSGGISDPNRQASTSPVMNGRMSAGSNEQGNVSPMGSGEMKEPEQQANRSSPWIEGTLMPNEQDKLDNRSPVGNREMPGSYQQADVSTMGSEDMKEREQQANRSSPWIEGMLVPNKQDKLDNRSLVGNGEVLGSYQQADMSIMGSEDMKEQEQQANRSSPWIVGMLVPNKQDRLDNRSPVGNGEMPGSHQQADMSTIGSGNMKEREQQANRWSPWIEGMLVPNKQACVANGVWLDPEKHSSDGGIDSDVSLQFENEKENYSKNLVNPNKVVFTCQQCVVTFESTQDLISHTASHTSNNFSFKCNVCTQVFRSTSGLQKHVEFHADHRNNFQCSFCFKSFPDRDNLEEHIIASHMSKRPHKCSYCPKAFRDPGSLQKHVRIHTGERPYKCTACEKSFAEYSSLRKHYRVHTGEQPYKCQYCPKAFSISGNLQRHILIHTGERPYKCSECSKTFNNPSHLRRHEKNLHSKLEGEK